MSFHSKTWCVFICLLLPLAIWPWGLQAGQASIPFFSARALDGRSVVFAAGEQAKPMILSFFFTTCLPCKKEIPLLYAWAKAKGVTENLLFIDPYFKSAGIQEAGDTTAMIEQFAAKAGVPAGLFFPDLVGALAKKVHTTGKLQKAESLGQMIIFPTLVILNSKGEVVFVLEGTDANFLHAIESHF